MMPRPWLAMALSFRMPRTSIALATAVLLATAGCGSKQPTTAPLPFLPKSEPVKEASIPAGPMVIDVTGSQFQWHIRYPGPDGEVDSDDDRHTIRHLHVPVGTRVTLRLHSTDYVYTLSLPHLELREIAVPELTFQLEFDADQVGTFELRGDQMCGYQHPDLIGSLVVQERSEFAKWYQKLHD